MHVHQCPQCELIFANEADVRDHLVNDHGADPEAIERRPRGWSRSEPGERTSPDLVHPSPPGTDEEQTRRGAAQERASGGS